MKVVFFSSVSGNTARFVEKLGLGGERIPLYLKEDTIEVDEPFVLVVPTYGGGTTRGAVPKQVIKFLNVASNRDLLQGIVTMGNTNFGSAFCLAGKIIHEKTSAPMIGNVELFGTPEDVQRIKDEIQKLGDNIGR